MADPGARPGEFETEAKARRMTLVGEFWHFLKDNKKWWLLPILVIVLLLGLAAILTSASGIAPFIYTLF